MTPCGAYCQPDKGVHAFVSAARRLGQPFTLEEVRTRVVGKVLTLTADECIPAWTKVLVLDVTPAETPPDPEWDVTYLETVQVVS